MITIRINNELNPRTEILDNVEHVVYPVIMINEGVHNRIFYPNSELDRSVQNWNGCPIPIYHPEKDGIPISCNSPEIYNKQVIGKVFNSHIDNNNLKADLYLNKDKINSLMPDLFTFLENDGKMEVSTGLFSDDIYQSGDFNGEEYDSIAINIRPDHLAILPGQKGACSWEDGCGIRANQEDKKDNGGKMKRGSKKPKNNKEGIEDAEEFVKINDEFLINPENKDEFKVNEADYEQVLGLVYRKLDSLDVRGEKYHYPVKVFQDNIIYRVQYNDNSIMPKLMQRNYSINEHQDAINWESDPIEVVRNETFTPKTNNDNKETKMKTMKDCCPDTVKEFIKQNSQFEGKEDDLMGMTEDVFKMVVLGVGVKENKEKDEPKTLSFDEVMEKADSETRESIAMGKKLLKNHRDSLIENIKTNSENSFSDEELNAFGLDMLEKLSVFAGKPKTNNNYGLQVPITNTTQEDEIEPLPDPAFDFDKEEK